MMIVRLASVSVVSMLSCTEYKTFMGQSAQAALANTLFHMKVRRSELLELPWV
jgi:hypothetical protein